MTLLRDEDHEIYDFRDPEDNGETGFQWLDIDPDWKSWTTKQYIDALQHPIAKAGFKRDYEAMLWADMLVLVMPCGRSAHLEAGWAAGMNKLTVVLLSYAEPELMYLMCDKLVTTQLALIDYVREVREAFDNIE